MFVVAVRDSIIMVLPQCGSCATIKRNQMFMICCNVREACSMNGRLCFHEIKINRMNPQMNIYVLKYLEMFIYICTKREPGKLAILKLIEWNYLDFLIII